MTTDVHGQEISLAVDYAENPVVRAMLRLIPGGVGSAADVLIVHRADQIKKERIRTFFDALGDGQVMLTPELINSNDFIHSLDATLRAALRSRRAEKIQMFARLLQHGMIGGEAQSVDDYEELVGVLDELSYREWQALMLFEHHLTNSPADPNPLARVQPFLERVCSRAGGSTRCSTSGSIELHDPHCAYRPLHRDHRRLLGLYRRPRHHHA